MKILSEKGSIILPKKRTLSTEKLLIDTITSKILKHENSLYLITQDSYLQSNYSILAHNNKIIFKLVAGQRRSGIFSVYEEIEAVLLSTDYKIYYHLLHSLGVKTPNNMSLTYIPAIVKGRHTDHKKYIILEVQEYIDSVNMFDYLTKPSVSKRQFMQRYELALKTVISCLPKIGLTLGFDPIPSNFLSNGTYVDLFPAFCIPGFEHSQLKNGSLSSKYDKAKFLMLFEPIPVLLNLIINFAIIKPELLTDIIHASLKLLDKKLQDEFRSYCMGKYFKELISFINIRIRKRPSNKDFDEITSEDIINALDLIS
jgi:hypothetical protein